MADASEQALHLKKLRQEMSRRGVSALCVCSPLNVRYLSGKEAGKVLVTKDEATLYVNDFFRELYGVTYSRSGYPLTVSDLSELKGALRSLRSKTVWVDDSLKVKTLRRLSRKKADESDCVLFARAVKTQWEVKMLKKSAGIAKAGMRRASQAVEEGVRELDVVAEVEATLRRKGSELPPFGSGMLLSSGKSSADIHAKASTKKICGGPVVVDLGAVYRGYHSDMTRTFYVGRTPKKERELLSIVKDVRDEVIDSVGAGTYASTVHSGAKKMLEAAGYRFHHLIGHGVGLEVHEYPSFRAKNRMMLRKDMVFTVEPGVYLPGRYGIRFEDTVHLTNRGCRKLT